MHPLTWVMGVCVFLGSYAIPLLENPELQANIALTIFIIPIACLGTHLYYRRGSFSPLSLAFIFITVAIPIRCSNHSPGIHNTRWRLVSGVFRKSLILLNRA